MLVEIVIEEGGDAEEHVQDVANDDAAQVADSVPQPQPQPQAQPQAADFPMSLLQEELDACVALTRRVEHLEYDKVAQALEITKLKRRVKKLEKGNMVKVLKLCRLKKVGTSQRIDTSKDIVMDDASNQGRMIDDLDKDDAVALMDDKEEEKKEEEDKEDEPAEVQEEVDVVTTAKLITEVVIAAIRVATASTKRRKRMVIRDPEEESTTSSVIPADTKSKDKGKRIMVEDLKPLKKKQQVEMDEEYARKLDYFKGMSYDDIRLIFEAKFNSNIEFLLKTKEQMEEEESRALQSINETPVQKAAKRRKLNKEAEDLKRHLEIVPDEDDDVYTEANLLARKVPIVDYEIIHLNNKPHYKIIQADRTHQLYTKGTGLSMEESKDCTWLSKELSAAKQKMMLLDSAAEGSLMLLSQVKAVNDKVLLLEQIPNKLQENTKFPLSCFGSYPRNGCNTLFTKKKSSNLLIVQMYVDEIIFGLTCQDMCDEFAKIMHGEFEMSMMGELNFFLGLQIKQMKDGIFFNQSKYIKEMLKKFGFEDSKPMKTPMSSDTKHTKYEECTTHLGLWYSKGTGIETVVYDDSDHAGDYVDQKSTSGIFTFLRCCLSSWFSKKQTDLAISNTEAEYVSTRKACQQALWMKQALVDYDVRLDDIPIMCYNKGAIGLSKNPVQHSRTNTSKYVTTFFVIMPDIIFSVCLCARFQEAPKTSHLEAVKCIFRYIKGTTHLGLWYPKGTGIETIVYADSDHAGDYVDQKSTSRVCTFVGCCLTSWFSKKQTALAISTIEAQFVSAEKACQQALWIRQALIDYDVRLDDVPIMCNNKGVIDINNNPVQYSCNKHIKIRHHFLRDNVQKGYISIKKVSSVDNISDILTKPLKHELFNYLHLSLGMMEHIS
nr:copia protein [Tanacetum cinerariifolium]